MKKITTAVAALGLLFTTSAFAADAKPAEATKVNTEVKTAFAKKFSGASEITWEKNSGFYFADFKVNGKSASAAYNEEGELVGTSSRIDFNQLPQDVTNALKNDYNGYDHALEAQALTYDGITSYYFAISNGKETLNLKSSKTGEFSVVERSTIN